MKKEIKKITLSHKATINKARNNRLNSAKKGAVATAIKSDIHESTIGNIESVYKPDKYTFGLINKLAKGNQQRIIDFFPHKPIRSNKIYPKFNINSVKSFGGRKAFRALILNGYLNESRSLEDIKIYAAIIFDREYNLSDFGEEKLKLIESGILLQGDGKEFPANTFILAKGTIIDWEL